MSKQIHLVTTPGCSACKCMEHILKDVQEDNPTFTIEKYRFADAPEFIKTNVNFTDFPVTIFIKDDVIKYNFQGTKSIKKVKQIISDIDF